MIILKRMRQYSKIRGAAADLAIHKCGGGAGGNPQSRVRLNLTLHGIAANCSNPNASDSPFWLPLDEFLRLLDVVRGLPDVQLTFDDGNITDASVALPALLDRGLTATFFIVAGNLGGANYLDVGELRSLHSAGMKIGNHGMRHRQWHRLARNDIQEEFVDARNVLEDHIGASVSSAACPFGIYDERTLRALRRFGYKRIFTSDRGWCRAGSWLQARNTLKRGDVARLDEVMRKPSVPRRVIHYLQIQSKRFGWAPAPHHPAG